MRTHRAARTARRGIALLYAVMAAFAAAGMVTLLIGVSMSSSKSAGARRAGVEAHYLAEGAIEAAKKEIQIAIANWTSVPEWGKVAIDGTEVGWRARPSGLVTTLTDDAGIQTLVQGFELEALDPATVDDPDHTPLLPFRHRGAAARVARIVNSEATPLFQFAVFYDSDLEILPGPSMRLFGRVHTNSNMYLGSNNTLTVDTNYLRSVGDMFRCRKDDPLVSTGVVDIRKWVRNPFDPSEPTEYFTMYGRGDLTALGITSGSGFDSAFTAGHDFDGDGDYTDDGDLYPFAVGALEYWQQPDTYAAGSGHTVQTADHDVSEAVVPDLGSIAMFEEQDGGDWELVPLTGEYIQVPAGTGTHAKGYYHANADLSIIAAADGTWKAYNESGIEITSTLSSAVVADRVYDARQANGGVGSVRTLDIDMEALYASGAWPANGLVYAAHYGAGTGTSAKGVRLKNGSALAAKLTVATENSIYIQGDYNIGDATHPKVGAAVIGDAVNLLSNAWDDLKTPLVLPSAASTSYNVAMITGTLDTTVGAYNGGLENLPRFHEDWTGHTCTIKGSFVNTWRSQHATAAWVYGGNRYQAPNRSFSYDPAFNSVLNLPPFTPLAVTARDVVTW